MADLSLETLHHPPFENDPPVKLNIPAKTIGLVYAIIAGIALVFAGIFGLIGLVLGGAIAAAGAAVGVSTGPLFFVGSLIRLVISIIGYGMVTFGGWKMYNLDHDGRTMAENGLLVLVIGSLVGVIASFSVAGIIFGLIGWVIGTAITGIFWYLLVISRFPDEAPLTGGGGGYTPPPGGYQPPPPPPPPSGYQPPPPPPPPAAQ